MALPGPGALAPPLPFVVPGTAQEFHHVGGLIHAHDLLNANPMPLNQEEMVERMNQLTDDNRLAKIIFKANLAIMEFFLTAHAFMHISQ